MRSPIFEHHDHDTHGNPTGGLTRGRGFEINWQSEPLVVDGMRREPIGAFVEDIIQSAIGRIEVYQASRFACAENAQALFHLRRAAEWLDTRTRYLVARGVEGGTHGTGVCD